jgi:hypothetical protein
VIQTPILWIKTRGIHQEQNDIGVLQCLLYGTHHGTMQQVLRLDHTRGVEEDHLRLFLVENTQHPVTGGLGLGGDDGELLPQKRVEQGGLPYVGPTDDGHVSGPMVRGNMSPGIYVECFGHAHRIQRPRLGKQAGLESQGRPRVVLSEPKLKGNSI